MALLRLFLYNVARRLTERWQRHVAAPDTFVRRCREYYAVRAQRDQ